jgi:sugar porter (SP) family MFS transporter
MPSFIRTMGAEGLSEGQWANLSSWITSSLLLGATFSSPFAAPLADNIGRKWCINYSCLLIFVGGVIQASSLDIWMMVCGRILSGLAIGLLSTTVPLYLAEVSPKSIRGSISSLFELTVAFGILLAFIITLILNQSRKSTGEPNSLNWRYILGIQAALAITLFLLILPLPESPRWLCSVSRFEKAQEVLTKTRWCLPVGFKKKDNEWVEMTNIDLEYDEMCADSKANNQKQGAWYDFSQLFDRSMLLRTSIAINIKIFQQLTGINSIMYYSSVIFVRIGISGDITTAVTGLVNFIATFLSLCVIDRLGRRPLLVYGSIGMCVCLLVVGGVVLGVHPINPMAANAIAVFICLFISNFAYSFGPIAW